MGADVPRRAMPNTALVARGVERGLVGLLAHAAPCLAAACVALLVGPALEDNSRRRAEVPDDAADPSSTAEAAGGMRDPAGRGSSSGVRKHSEDTLGEYFYRASMTQCSIPA